MSKSVQRRRIAIGLPPLNLKYETRSDETPATHQWTAYAVDTWSTNGVIRNTHIAEGTSDTTRTSQKVRILATPVTFMLYQQPGAELTYRVMMVKFFDLVNSDNFEPRDILRSTATITDALWSGYKQFDARTFANAASNQRYKVLYDKRFTWDSTNPNKSIRVFRLTIPAQNLYYDEDIDTGANSKNSVGIFWLTDATEESALYTWGCNLKAPYLDM